MQMYKEYLTYMQNLKIMSFFSSYKHGYYMRCSYQNSGALLFT